MQRQESHKTSPDDEGVATPISTLSSNGSIYKPGQGTTATTSKTLPAATRPISPPPKAAVRKVAIAPGRPTSNAAPGSSKPQPPKKIEQLTPRLVKSGGPFQQRLTLLKHLHAELVRLNNEMKKSTAEDIRSLARSDSELVSMALDKEEEANAKGGGLYRGLMTQKLAAYKKMNLDSWVKELRALVEKETDAVNGSSSAAASSSSGSQSGRS